MKKIKKLLVTVLAFTFLFCSLGNSNVYASEIDNAANHMGPSIIVYPDQTDEIVLERSSDGNFYGTARSGLTEFKIYLSGNTGGISTLHEIILTWKGTNQVNSVKATSLTISRTFGFNPPNIYYDKPFSKECGSQTIGTRSLGVVTIPSDIKYVTVKTSGFLVYFNNEDWWTSTGDLNGLCDCNQ